MCSIKSNLIFMVIFIVIIILSSSYLTGYPRTIVTFVFAFLSSMVFIRYLKLMKLGKDYRFILSAFSEGSYFKHRCDFCENKTDLTHTIGAHLIKKYEDSADEIEFYCLTHGNELFNKIEREQRVGDKTLGDVQIKAMTYANILRQGAFFY